MKTIAISIGSFVLGLLLSSHITRSEIRYEEKIVPRVTKRNKIIEAANNVAKTVVSISVTQTRIYRTEPFFFHDDFFDQFFRDIFPPNYYKKEIRSLGSGVIISRDGYIITNEHVIRDGQKIKVTLGDGRTFDAQVVGSDRTLDIALLKIEAKDLPTAPLGDSDSLTIGEWAVALGNPFGFLLEDHQPTVTVGVISALHRSIRAKGEMVYRDMIQTDAAINPGNSGGPLIDLTGAVIGINTFILTAGGGSEGIGFARPINIVKKKIREFQRGENLTPWFGMTVAPDEGGVRITAIDPDGPAYMASLKVGDIIRSFAHRRIRGPVDWANVLVSIAVGDTVDVEYLRRGEKKYTKLIVVQTKPQRWLSLDRYGMTIAPITDDLIRSFGLVVKTGVVVVKVAPDGLAARIGIKAGDVITEVNRVRIQKLQDLKILSDVRRVAMIINRQGINFRIYFEL